MIFGPKSRGGYRPNPNAKPPRRVPPPRPPSGSGGGSRPALPVWWVCLDCGETGQGDGGAEWHTLNAGHGTTTQTYPLPPCMECSWEMLRDGGGRFIRYALHEPCADHYRERG